MAPATTDQKNTIAMIAITNAAVPRPFFGAGDGAGYPACSGIGGGLG